MNLAQRSISSATWNIGASAAKVVILFGRSVLLSRWLPKSAFGVYATATAIITISVVIANLGMGGAFLHRSPQTEDEDEAAATHFTLKLIFTIAWLALLTAGAFLFTTGPTRTALLVLTLVNAVTELTQTPSLILKRRVVHRRLAILQTMNALLTTVVALPMAWVTIAVRNGYVAVNLAWRDIALWTLLATDVVTMLLSVFFLYVWRPIWRPRLAWSADKIRYYLSFGSRNLWNGLLLRSLNEVDDIWTRVYLGTVSLADYSRAYTFATYPSRVLASPINEVAGGTYAELKGDRLRLSRAFFRTNAFLLRSAFFVGGMLALIAPEFIRILLTEKWITMLGTFRLMLVFTLLDPIKITIAHLFVAVGRPEEIGKSRLLQLGTMIFGLYALGLRWGIAGVALAVDLMLVVGIVALLWQAREHVDFSPRRLFGAPTVALVMALILGWAATHLPFIPAGDWWAGLVKAAVFGTIYGGILALLEHEQLINLFWEPILSKWLASTLRLLPFSEKNQLKD